MAAQYDLIKQKAGHYVRRTLWIILAALVVFGIGYYVYRTYTISEGSSKRDLVQNLQKGGDVQNV